MLTNPTFYLVAAISLIWGMYSLWMENKKATYNGKTLAIALLSNGAMAAVTLYCYRVSLHMQAHHTTLLVYACVVWASCALRAVIAFRQLGRVRRPSEWSQMGVVLVAVVGVPVLMLPFMG